MVNFNQYRIECKMNVKNYINRINYKGPLTPTFEVLKSLQEAHLLTIPFENLDIHYNNPINLEVSKLYEKVVENKRGGFCYELNGLFNVLLKQLGFNSKMISANVFNANKEEFGQVFDHMAIIVKIDQVEFIVDVGFGEFTFHPLRLEIGAVQIDPRGEFIIENFENENYKISKFKNGTKIPQYIFTNQKRELVDFTEMCLYHQTSENSHFTQKKLISMPIKKGRVTITDNVLKITENEEEVKNVVLGEAEYQEQLLNWFDIEESEI